MENESLNKVEKLTPFTKMIMTIGTLPSSFYASMSYYESMVWLYEYLKNQVIPTVNNNAEAVEELQTAFTTLKNWIENYFDNLDVQEEINTKLDEMAEDGSLTNLIKGYVDPIYQAYEEEIDGEIHDFKEDINEEISDFKSDVNYEVSVINTKVNNATSGSPLPASSTDEMTDTTKIYVNTTNGYWYYYDGDSWEQGGLYLSYDSSIINHLTEEIGIEKNTLDSSTFNANDFTIGQNIDINSGELFSVNLATLTNKITSFSVTGIKTDNSSVILYPNRLTANTMYFKYAPATLKKISVYAITTSEVSSGEITLTTKVYGNTTEDLHINDFITARNTDYTDKLQYGNALNYTAETTFESGYINSSTGEVTASNSIFHSPFIPVKPNTKCYQSGGYLDNFYACYDMNYNFVSGLSITRTGGTDFNALGEFTTPDNAYYYRYSGGSSTPSANSYLSEIGYKYQDYGLNLTNLIDTNKSLQKSKILIIGDSISTDVYGSYKKWVTDLIENGTFINSNVTNSSEHATGFATERDGNDDFYSRLQAIQNKNTYDLVITFGGVNDWGNSELTWSEFTTAVDNYCSYLINNFTQARIVFLTPLKAYGGGTNTIGKYLSEYADYIKEKAKYYAFPVLDLFNDSGFCPHIDTFKNMWTLYLSQQQVHDGIHPNADYEKYFLAPMIAGFLQDKIYK